MTSLGIALVGSGKQSVQKRSKARGGRGGICSQTRRPNTTLTPSLTLCPNRAGETQSVSRESRPKFRRWSHTDRRYYSKCDDASASQLAQLQPRSQLLAHSLPAVTSSVSVGQYQLAVRPRCHQRFRACKSLALGSSMGLLIRTSYLPSKPPRRSRACRHNSQSPRGQNGSASERRNSVKGEAARRGQSALGLACSSLCGHPPLQRPTRLLLSDLC